MLEMLVVYAALFLLSQLLAPKPPKNARRPAGLGDFIFPTTDNNRVIPLLWGTVRIPGGNVTWYGDFVSVPFSASIKYSLFSSATQVVGFNYYIGFHLVLCQAFDELLGIHWGDIKVYDPPTDGDPTGDPVPFVNITRFLKMFGGNDQGTGGINGQVDILYGGLDQPVDPYLAQFQQATAGTTRTPNYGLAAGLVFKQFYIGNTTQLKPVSAEVKRIPNGLGLADNVAAINGFDCNPINVAFEIITNPDWGMGYPTSMIDFVTMTAAATLLATEQNGFSMVLDQPVQHDDLLHEIERQIGGVFYIDHRTGLWSVKLIRNDYDINTVPELSKATNIKEITKFTRGTWADTKNQFNLTYNDRSNNYTQTSVMAQDMANMQMQGSLSVTTGRNLKATDSYPGIKDPQLAATIAWRDLRNMSQPRISATFVVTTALYGLKIGDPFAFTDETLKVTKLPMRVARIDYSTIDRGEITIEAIDDVAAIVPPSGAAPPITLWTDPVQTVQSFARYFVMEAPNALNMRAVPSHGDDGELTFFWVGAVPIASSTGFLISWKSFDLLGFPLLIQDDSQTLTFVLNGSLKDDLPQTSVYVDSIIVTFITPSLKDQVLKNFVQRYDDYKGLGSDLQHLLLIDDEMFLFQAAFDNGGNEILLSQVYRCICDTSQPYRHLAGAVVFFTVGETQYIGQQNLSGTENSISLLDGFKHEVALRAISRTDVQSYGAASKGTIVTSSRSRRPLSPGEITIDGVGGGTSSNLEFTGSGDATGTSLLFIRRDFRKGEEVTKIGIDASLLPLSPPFPSANNTQYVISVYNDPLGANVLLYTLAAAAGPTFTLLRDDILRYNGGVVPAFIGIKIDAQHTYGGTLYSSFFPPTWVCSVTSALNGQFVFGSFDAQSTGHGNPEISNTYTVTVTGTHSFTIFTAASGNIQYSKNGAAFLNLITAGSTTANLSLTAGDTIVLRHQFTTVGQERLLTMNAPGAGLDGFALCYKS